MIMIDRKIPHNYNIIKLFDLFLKFKFEYFKK